MKKRKPQTTVFLTDKNGNRLYKAADMGFGDTHWAKIKSEAIIDALVKIRPVSWEFFRIDYDRETAFTKALERACKKADTAAKYICIRASGNTSDDISSWFLLHRADETPLPALSKWTGKSRTLESTRDIEEYVSRLFSPYLHPEEFDNSKKKRFSISNALRQDLVVSRMETLIVKARNREDHQLIDRIKPFERFTDRLAIFIKADTPLIHNLKIVKVFLALVKIRDDKNLITKDEVIIVIQKLLEGRDWEKEGFYKGLPKHGSLRDKKEGGFVNYEGKHGALSVLIDKNTRSAWTLEYFPEAEDGEIYLD